jgi:hypothetical protein
VMELETRGARLWANLLHQDPSLEDESNPMREVALTACRTADRVDHLEEMAAATEPVVEGRQGPMIHPLFAEVRQQAQLLARLVAALRLPDEVTGRKPQRRQVRGVQQPKAVSSIDRVRVSKGA